MDRIKVLIATDGSEPALRAARTAASMLSPGSAIVRLVTVLSFEVYPESLVPGEVPPPDHAETERKDSELIERATGEPRRVLEASGHEVTVAHRYGNVRAGILEEVESFSPDLLVLGRRGVGGLERMLGSVSEHVVRHVKVPVLLVP